jgi:D-glutamate cyclase
MDDLTILGNEIDRIIGIEIRAQGFYRDIVHRFQDAARAKLGGPMTLLGAQGLVERVKPGDFVVVSSGAVGPPAMPKGETDGPPGAAAIGRAISLGLGAIPIYVGEDWTRDPTVAASQAAGIHVRDDEAEARQFPYSALFKEFPKDVEEAKKASTEFLDHFKPTALIALEKLSANKKGILHSALGYDIGKPHCRVDLMFMEAHERGIFTIGIGDNGNEIGFGTILEEVEEISPVGDTCHCPCGGGITSATVTDVLIVANVSNWGGYGLCAMLAAVLDNPELLHDLDTERRMLEDCVRAGAFDGCWVRQIPNADLLPVAVQQALLTLMHSAVASSKQTVKRPGF